MQIGVEDSEIIFMTMMLKIHKFKRHLFMGFFLLNWLNIFQFGTIQKVTYKAQVVLPTSILMNHHHKN
jgi:hypothetical protein